MTRALLVIDVQESFRVRESWRTFENPAIAERVQRLVDAARGQGDHVFWVLHAEPGTGTAFDPALGHVRLLGELDRHPEDPLLTKTSINAFTTTNLLQQLVQRGVNEVTVCGIRTEQCCETTARLARDLGFAVTFVADATTTSPAGTLSAQEVIERTVQILREREFATVVSTDELTTGAVLAS